MCEIFGHIATKDEKTGAWVYKAKENVPLEGKKPSKGIYREKPVFKLIEQYEQASKNTFKESLKNTIADITKFLKKNSQ